MSFKYTPQTLKKIESLLEEMGYITRYEKGNFNSGYCILEDRKIAVVNKFLTVESRINVLLEIVPTIIIDIETLSSEGKVFYEQLMKTPIG
jgi:hypothetical protein